MKDRRQSDSLAKWFKALLTILLLAGTFWVLGQVGAIVKMVVIAALLAYMLDPLVTYMESYGMGRTLSTLVVFTLIVGTIVTIIVLVAPQASGEIKAIKNGISAGKAADILHSLEDTLEDKLSFLGVGDLDLTGKLQRLSKDMGNKVYKYFLNAMGIISNLFIIPFIMFFFLKDGRRIIKAFITFVPNRYFEMTASLIHKTDRQLGGYIRGQFMDSAIIGGLTVIALWGLGIKYFLMLGIVLGISNLVPFIGPIIGSVPAILMALIQTGDVNKAIYVTLAMVVVQIIDNGMVKPVVVARMVSLHPLLVILAVIIGGKFFGVMGMILSVPVTGIIKLVAQEAAANIRLYRYT